MLIYTYMVGKTQKSIYIVGNVTKDVYLRLDNRLSDLHPDENGTYWLDLPFNNHYHRYFKRTSVFGGSAVSCDVLKRLGFDPSVSGYNASFDENLSFQPDLGQDHTYRYIICKDNDTAIFAPSTIYETTWNQPKDNPDILILDRPSILPETEKQDLLNYLNDRPDIDFYCWINKDLLGSPKFANLFATRAKMVFVALKDIAIKNVSDTTVKDVAQKYLDLGVKTVVAIDEDTIFIKTPDEFAKVSWSLGEKTDLFTSLTTKTTISSTIIAADILGRNLDESLLFAKYNTETSTLSNARTESALDDLISDKKYEVIFMEESDSQEATVENQLHKIAKDLVAPGKGILAADTSGGSTEVRFKKYGIPFTEENRRNYRNMLFTTPDLDKYVNGVIMFDETARQFADNGQNYTDFLSSLDIIPGIKVDEGKEDLPGFDGEQITLGLDNLKNRLKEYSAMGLKFAKWRAAFEVGKDKPSNGAIAANVQALARYALDCQEAGIVPIVEPEVVYDGNFTIEQCKEATSRVLFALFTELDLLRVDLKGILLKTNMVMAGKQSESQSTPEEVASATVEVLKEYVPADVPGIVFLSGGQSMEQATDNLAAISKLGPFNWQVTFSYDRALQESAMETWSKDMASNPPAQAAFTERLVANTDAIKSK